MIRWKHKIDLTRLFEGYDEGRLTVKAVGEAVCQQLLALTRYLEPEDEPDELVELAVDFQYTEDLSDFNSLMDTLYSWADTDNRLWVETV